MRPAHARARPDSIILLLSNPEGFCSPRGLVSDKTERILENWLRAVIHQFVARGVDTFGHQLAAKFAASSEPSRANVAATPSRPADLCYVRRYVRGRTLKVWTLPSSFLYFPLWHVSFQAVRLLIYDLYDEFLSFICFSRNVGIVFGASKSGNLLLHFLFSSLPPSPEP
jgi:hypothetical protein